MGHGLGALRERENLLQHRPHQPTQFRQMRQPPLAPDKEAAQLILELLNRVRQRRLAHPAPLRRPREVQRLAQRHKIPDLIQLHWTQAGLDHPLGGLPFVARRSNAVAAAAARISARG